MNDKWMKLLLRWKNIPKVELSRTSFEIAGYPHLENVSSNILAFYFCDENEHNLGDLFLKSILEIISNSNHDSSSFENITVQKEITTDEGKRIDLIIETPEYLIGIENKLFSWLHNDLTNYRKHLENSKKYDKQKIFAVVLSLNRLDDDFSRNKINSNEFINITYDDLFSRVRKNIGDYINNSNERYSRILLEYIETIENLKGRNMENREMELFFQEHKEDLNELTHKYNEYLQSISNKIYDLKNIMSELEFSRTFNREWIYNKCCLVYDYLIDNHSVSIDTYIGTDGWYVELFGRNTKSSSYINTELISNHELLSIVNNNLKKSGRNGIIIYENKDINAIESTSKKLLELIVFLEKIKSNKGSNV